MNSIKEKIEIFFNSTKNMKEKADKFKEKFDFLCYPLYFVLLDILAQYAFPNIKENEVGKRFISLIDSYSKWEYKNYVNIIRLNCLLKIEKKKKCFKENKEYENLKVKIDKAVDKLSQQWKSPLISKEIDLTIEKFSLPEKSKYWELIDKARYASLIYQMRNNVIHRLVLPSLKNPFAVTDIQMPYYYSFSDNGKKAYGFCIPVEFIPMLVEECSNNLKEKVIQEKRDPSNIFQPTVSWFHILPKSKKYF